MRQREGLHHQQQGNLRWDGDLSAALQGVPTGTAAVQPAGADAQLAVASAQPAASPAQLTAEQEVCLLDMPGTLTANPLSLPGTCNDVAGLHRDLGSH